MLSGWATRRYGCEYDIDVGCELLGAPIKDGSRGVPGNGEDERVDGDEADRNAERVKECSSAAVASREPRSLPSCERFNS